MANHTPGPWWLDDENHIGAGNEVIAVVKPPIDPITRRVIEEQWNANASLLLAAPELLEASNALYFLAESLMKHLGIDPEATDFDFKLKGETVVKVSAAQFMAKARAAIDKATGSPQ